MLKKGFTLIEMIIVISIITILMLMAAPSVVRYLGTADQVSRTETAKTIYLAAQNQLTQLRALGHLKSAYGGEISGKYFETDADGNYTDDLLASDVNENNVYTALTATNYPAYDSENGQANFVRYLSKPAGIDASNPLYQFLKPAIIDEDILEGTILIEYNILTGKVLSVFYSELETVNEFNYTAQDNSSSDIFGARAESYNSVANSRQQGYFGVDYTGNAPPESRTEIAIHLYDGYDDGHDDTLILPELSRYNKPLDAINATNTTETLENVLYAEIFVEIPLLTDTALQSTYDLSIELPSGTFTVLEDFDFSAYTDDDETFEDAIEYYNNGLATARPALIYRNDLAANTDFARFIWVLDYVGGDMSAENADRHKYSITQTEDAAGTIIDFEGLTEITVSILDNNDVDALPITSNAKNPLFADNSNSATPDPLEANIATARHLSNIRHQAAFADDTYVYTQIEDINFASEDGFVEINSTFAEDAGTDDAWNLKMQPLPELKGTYTGLYSELISATDSEDGVHTIQNLNIYNVNLDTTESIINNHSVGLFEAVSGEISHLMFIDPYLEIENTTRNNVADEGKYAGVVTGYLSGTAHHITVMSSSETSPIVDDDSGVDINLDAHIVNDYVGGVVGMVSGSIAENAIHHILYLAVAPSETIGEDDNETYYESPIIGTNLRVGLTNAYSNVDDQTNLDEAGESGPVQTAIDDDSCYYLLGTQLRPYDDDIDDDGTPDSPAPEHSNLNVNTVTNGFGQGISTNDMYEDMQDTTSDFYQNFMLANDGTGTIEYRFVENITEPLKVDDEEDAPDTNTNYISSLGYPYPYYGHFLPNADAIDETSTEKDLNFIWPVAELEPFKAEFVYYEVYGNKNDTDAPEVGIYQVIVNEDASTTIIDRLIDIDANPQYMILNDGYAIKVNRPYSMLETGDFTFSVNGTALSETEIEAWLNVYSDNDRYDEFTSHFRSDVTSTHIESVFTIDNSTFESAVNNTVYNDTTDVIELSLTNDRQAASVAYINPLFAKAIYLADATNAANMTYSVRTARHLNNIGFYANSESVNSSFTQELNLDLSNFEGFLVGTSFDWYNTDDWFYTVTNPILYYSNLKYGTQGYIYGSELNFSGSVAAITSAFNGNYDGGGHTISNYTKRDSSDTALFEATTSSATIENLNIDNFDITSTGSAIAAAVVATNAGILQNINVNNSKIHATFNTYASGTEYNRPSNVGGAVAENSGTLDNVVVSNSAITRDEVVSPVTYGLLSYGAGGIIGSNSGTLKNSGAVNTSVTVLDNFVGGLVGIATGTESVIEDSYFVHNGQDATGLPVSPISYDDTATLSGTNPRQSIGGIVGGIVYGEEISSGNIVNDEATISDTLFLALAPSMDTNADTTPDESYPLMGTKAAGFTTLQNNIHLAGSYYSSDNTSFEAFAYNSALPVKLPTSPKPNALVALPSENIELSWLSAFGNGQLSGWTLQTGSAYPTPNKTVIAAAPYAANRPKQHTTFTGTGTVTQADGTFSARLLYGDSATASTEGFVMPNATTPVTLEITNTTASAINLVDLTTLKIDFGNYADYIDTTAFDSATTPVNVQDNLGANRGTVTYSFDNTSNVMAIDMASISDTTYTELLQNEKISFTFNLTAKNEFTSGTFTNISTAYYHIAMQASLGITVSGAEKTATLTSDKLYIQPKTSIATTFNGANTPIENTDPGVVTVTIPVESTVATSNIGSYTQKGIITQIIPSGFALDDSTLALEVDSASVALVKDNNYTITSNTNGTTTLEIKGIEPSTSAKIAYNLTYIGADGTFDLLTNYSTYVYNGTVPITGNAFAKTDQVIIEAPPSPSPPAPAPPAPASLNEDNEQPVQSTPPQEGEGGELKQPEDLSSGSGEDGSGEGGSGENGSGENGSGEDGSGENG